MYTTTVYVSETDASDCSDKFLRSVRSHVGGQ